MWRNSESARCQISLQSVGIIALTLSSIFSAMSKWHRQNEATFVVITLTILNLFLMERVRIILGHFKNPSIAIVRNLSRNFNYLPLCRGPWVWSVQLGPANEPWAIYRVTLMAYCFLLSVSFQNKINLILMINDFHCKYSLEISIFLIVIFPWRKYPLNPHLLFHFHTAFTCQRSLDRFLSCSLFLSISYCRGVLRWYNM